MKRKKDANSIGHYGVQCKMQKAGINNITHCRHVIASLSFLFVFLFLSFWLYNDRTTKPSSLPVLLHTTVCASQTFGPFCIILVGAGRQGGELPTVSLRPDNNAISADL
jgi:hypothetical protein